jgi:hypothetical protein
MSGSSIVYDLTRTGTIELRSDALFIYAYWGDFDKTRSVLGVGKTVDAALRSLYDNVALLSAPAPESGQP